MKIKFPKEEEGEFCYMVVWISIGSFLSVKHLSTKKEALEQYKWLKMLKMKNVALYKLCEVVR